MDEIEQAPFYTKLHKIIEEKDLAGTKDILENFFKIKVKDDSMVEKSLLLMHR